MILTSGTGSQNGGLKRWGDYSSLALDPVDDCTFWYTTEYLTTSGTFNWHTRVGTFKFANCPNLPPPIVTGIAPANGPSSGGTPVTISGTNFQSSATATVGGVALTGVSVTGPTTLSGTTGAHAPGTGNPVVVINPDSQSATCACTYTYDPAPAPTVTTISPANGPSAGGTLVTITGTAFQAGATATIGGVTLSAASVLSDTTLTGTTGTHAVGTVSVVVTNPDTQSGTCACTYEYLVVPVISNVKVSPNPTTATVTWTTDIGADSQVEYGTTTAYGSKSALNSSLVTSHSVRLSGLTRLTTYHYRVLSRASSSGLAVSGDFTFTTK